MWWMPFVLASLIVSQSGEKKEESMVETPEIEEVDPFQFTYIPVGKRDPFEAFEVKSSVQAKSENPLLNYSISDFSLSGVVYGMANPRAIVKDPVGLGHIIRRGTRIGKQRGRVMRILRDQVVVAERYRDNLGKLMVREVSLKLTTENEGAK